MMQERTFGDLSQVQADQHDELPAGEYAVRAINLKMKATQTNGERLAVQFEVIEGQHAGRFYFDGFNLVNANPQAVQIALQDIKRWMIASGMHAEAEQPLTMSNIMKLEGKPLVIGLKPRKNGDGMNINKFMPYGAGIASGAPMQPQQPMQYGQAPQQPMQPQQVQQPATFQQGGTASAGAYAQQAPVQAQPMGGQAQPQAAPNVAPQPMQQPMQPQQAAPQPAPMQAAPVAAAPWQQQQ